MSKDEQAFLKEAKRLLTKYTVEALDEKYDKRYPGGTKCGFCGELYKSRDELRKHEDAIMKHGGDPNIRVIYCDI